jgi:hypothetical protein
MVCDASFHVRQPALTAISDFSAARFGSMIIRARASGWPRTVFEQEASKSLLRIHK